MRWFVAQHVQNLACPLYFCTSVKRKDLSYFILGGGGGAARTGVLNYVKLTRWNNHQLEVLDEKTLPDVPTSVCRVDDWVHLVVGPEIWTFELSKEKTLVFQGILRPDSTTETRQTVICSNDSSKLLAVGNDEGRIRVYPLHISQDSRPQVILSHHKKSIVDMDFNGDLLVSVSLDRKCCIWNCQTGERLRTIEKTIAQVYDIKAHFRCCRFSLVNVASPGLLYTVDVSIDRGSFVSGWRIDNWEPVFSRKVSADPVTCMSTCSINGREYLAIGNNEGHVDVWIHDPSQTENLLSISRMISHSPVAIGEEGWINGFASTQVRSFFRHHKAPHILPVTGLCWSIQDVDSGLLLSTSADGRVNLFHTSQTKETMAIWWILAILVIILAVALSFYAKYIR